MERPIKIRLAIALACYAALAAVALFALDGALRIVLLIFLAGLALRTISAAGHMED